jgi:transcriptional regulator with GAF, ATPase, and Fis domain
MPIRYTSARTCADCGRTEIIQHEYRRVPAVCLHCNGLRVAAHLPPVPARPAEQVDPVVVSRAASGHRVPTTMAERIQVVAALTARGYSATEIAARLGVTDRTVVRYRSEYRRAVPA